MIDTLRVYYVAIIAVVALLAWLVVKAGGSAKISDQETKSAERTRRDELIETRKKIRRQIAILKSPSRGGDYTSYSREAGQRLQGILDEIEEQLKAPKFG
jgi:hypothetical protein